MKTPQPWTRREFLQTSGRGLGLVAFASCVPAFLSQSLAAGAPRPEKDRRILVVVQLAGGNDGLNTVIPFEDPVYYRLRPNLAIERKQVLPLVDGLGLHPKCGALAELYKEGQLGIVQGVGYPNPNRSHFRSTDIWESADTGEGAGRFTGWLGRYLDSECSGRASSAVADPDAIHTRQDVPPMLIGEVPAHVFGVPERSTRNRGGTRQDLLQRLSAEATYPDPSSTGHYLQHRMMDTLVTEERVGRIVDRYRPMATYPQERFAQSLKHIAALIAGGLQTRVYYASLSGFDTHVSQQGRHASLLKRLSEGLSAFQQDLNAHQLADQVLTMTMSEFGRRPAENGSRGTDHGTAAPLFLMGSGLQQPLAGSAPHLSPDKKRDLSFTTDFRRVYASVLEQWLDCRSVPILGEGFAPLDLLPA